MARYVEPNGYFSKEMLKAFNDATKNEKGGKKVVKKPVNKAKSKKK